MSDRDSISTDCFPGAGALAEAHIKLSEAESVLKTSVCYVTCEEDADLAVITDLLDVTSRCLKDVHERMAMAETAHMKFGKATTLQS